MTDIFERKGNIFFHDGYAFIILIICVFLLSPHSPVSLINVDKFVDYFTLSCVFLMK